MGSIVVSGAAGLIGSHLCEAFAAAGWQVRAIDRPGAECAEAKAAGATASEIDLSKPEGALAAAEVARGSTLFAHCAFPRDTADREAALDSVRAACAAALTAGVPLLLLSSCSVYGRPSNLPCDEGAPKLPVDLEGEIRWAVEREAWRARRQRGLKLVVLRPSMTYGPRQRRGIQASLVVAALAARAGRALWVPRRGPVVHPVHAADVAQAALLLAEDPAQHDGRAFNVADDAPLPLEELTRAVLEAAGAHEAGALPYSPAPARLFLWLLRRVPNWMFWGPLNRRLSRAWLLAFRGQPPVPPPQLGPALLEQFSADRYFDTRKLRLLGFSPKTPSAVEGLRLLARESRAKGLLPAPRPQLEGRA